MLCWTPDGTPKLIIHLILLLTAFITVHLYFVCYFSHIPVYIIIICSHIICRCTPLFLHTHWEFWLPGFAHPGLCMLSYWSGNWRGSPTLRGA